MNRLGEEFPGSKTSQQVSVSGGLGTSVAPRQQRAPTLAVRDYQRIVKRTRELVALCRESGLTARELVQLVEGNWKEVDREGQGESRR